MTGAARLLERDGELAAIESLARTARTRGAVAVIEAPAGIGKTALLSHARRESAGLGMSVMHAQGAELERDFAFGIARQLLEPALASASSEKRAALIEAAGGFAARLLDLDSAPSGAALTTDASFAALRALTRLVAALSQERPLLLAIDDLHWADSASLRWLAYLAPRLADLPVLVLTALRTDEPCSSPELEAVLTHAGVTRLAPLSRRAVGALVRSEMALCHVEDVFVEACHEATGGNPLYLAELISELKRAGVAADQDGAKRVTAIGPSGISRTVLARLARLSPDAISVARVVAVLEANAEPLIISQLADVPEARARAAADALASAGILENRLPLTFVHPILRAAVYTDLGPARRAELHARAADALAAAGAATEVIAAHILACDPHGEPAAVSVLRRAAADALARGAPETAVTYLQRALKEPATDSAQRALLLAELGAAEACGARGNAGSAIEHLSQALAGGLEAEDRARAARLLAGVLMGSDRGEEAARALSSELEDLGDGPVDVAMPLLADLAVVMMSSPQANQIGRGQLARFAGASAGAGPRAARLANAMAAGAATTFGGDACAARALAMSALDDGRLLAEETADSLAFYLAPLALLWSEHPAEARMALSAAVSDAESRGSSRGLATALSLRALAKLRLGELVDARRDAELALSLTREIGLRLGEPIGSLTLLEVSLSSGQLDEAQTLAAELSLRPTVSVWGAWLLFVSARVALESGHIDSAIALARRCGRQLTGWQITDWPVLPWRSVVAMGLAGQASTPADVPSEASRLVSAELENARRFGAARLIGVALLATSRVEAARGSDLRTAVLPLLEEAHAVLDGTTARLEQAHALVELGAAQRRAGSTESARRSLREGLARARSCSASALARRAHEELEATGLRRRKILAGGVDALTPSERRVAEMAASGMTNKEIAHALFLASRTVETHLAHTYEKLDIRGRRELAARLR